MKIFQTDVTKYDQCEWLVNESIKEFEIDILILNAGIGAHSKFRDIKDETVIENVMKTNYLGYAYMMKAALPHLKPGSHVVVLSSLSGEIGLPFWTVYCASKFAVNGFFEALRIEEP